MSREMLNNEQPAMKEVSTTGPESLHRSWERLGQAVRAALAEGLTSAPGQGESASAQLRRQEAH